METPGGGWWLDCFKTLGEKKTRKLIKTPAMTFSYGAASGGMSDQIEKTYANLWAIPLRPKRTRKSWQKKPKPEPHAAYLAAKILEACKEVMPEPARVMKYIQTLAEHRAKDGRGLEWTNPTGFPVDNTYREPKIIRLSLLAGGKRIRHNVTVGYEKELAAKTISSACPNVVHSMDAAHLIRSAIAAASEGITDLVTVHDCFSCLAPQATRFNQILRRELAILYVTFRVLMQLHSTNVGDIGVLPPPPPGPLDPLDVQYGEYAFA